MIVLLASMVIADARLARWLTSNPQPIDVANAKIALGIKCAELLPLPMCLQWPMIYGADKRSEKDSIPRLPPPDMIRSVRRPRDKA